MADRLADLADHSGPSLRRHHPSVRLSGTGTLSPNIRWTRPTTGGPPMKFRTRLLALAAVLMIVGTACSTDDATSPTSGGGYDAFEVATPAAATTTTSGAALSGAAEGDETADLTNAAPLESAPTPAELGRSIVYTATIEIEVADVIAAGNAAQQAVAPLGGLLFGQETTTGPNARSILTIKVRPEDFQEALGRLAGTGTLLHQPRG